MDLDLPYEKFKILFINIFSILYKAATLNLYKLQLDLKDINNALKNVCNGASLLPHLLILLISLLLMSKFLFGYISLAANVVAIFPILTDDQPDLLLPTIVSQAIENILLSFVELLLGYVTVRYYMPGRISIFVIFLTKMIIKMSLSVSTVNMYSDLYNKLKFPTFLDDNSLMGNEESKETLLKKQSLG